MKFQENQFTEFYIDRLRKLITSVDGFQYYKEVQDLNDDNYHDFGILTEKLYQTLSDKIALEEEYGIKKTDVGSYIYIYPCIEFFSEESRNFEDIDWNKVEIHTLSTIRESTSNFQDWIENYDELYGFQKHFREMVKLWYVEKMLEILNERST